MNEPAGDDRSALLQFVVQLGAAMSAAGQPVYLVQERLQIVANAYGASSVRVSAFPTFLMVTMGRGEPVTLELATSLSGPPRLDQVAAIDRLVRAAMAGRVEPADGLRELRGIADLERRFGSALSIVGYTILSVGLVLILRPSPSEVFAAAGFGAIVGVLRWLVRRQSTLSILMPVVAALAVSALTALAIDNDVTEIGIRPVVAALVVFLPGAALTTAVLELAAGQTVSGSSRLVAGSMQLALLAFGILAGIEMVGVSATRVFAEPADRLGVWAPAVGVLIFAFGVRVAHSAPPRSFPGMLGVLYVAWGGQLLGNVLFGGYVSGLVGATLMTVAAFVIARLPSAMPAHALFLPGFWLLVPGALGLIGVARLAGGAAGTGTGELIATVSSIFAVALGVLIGSQLWVWAVATGRVVGDLSVSASQAIGNRRAWFHRISPPSDSEDTEPGES